MKQTVAVINGPNINMLGSREISVYGEERWTDIEKSVSACADQLNLEVIFYQSNHEGAIVDFIQQNSESLAGIIIILGVSPSSGYELMHEPGFPVLRVGSRMVVPKDAFIRWVESHTGGGG